MKIKFYFRTLRASLFFYHSLLILLILMMAGAVSYLYFSWNFMNNLAREQNALGTSLLSALENELDRMNTVSMNISYSNFLKTMFREYQQLDHPDGNDGNEADKFSSLKRLFDSIMAIMGPFHGISQVNLYSPEGMMIGSGLFNEERQVNLEGDAKLQTAIALDGYKLISPPGRIEFLGRKNLHLKDHHFISLMRIFKDQHYQTEGIVEVLQDCESFFAYTDTLQSKRPSLKIFLLDQEGQVFFPYEDVPLSECQAVYQAILRSPDQSILHSVTLQKGEDPQILSFFTLGDYDFYLAILESRNVLFSSLRKFRISFFILLILITAYTLFISYSVSSRVTRPLDHLVLTLSGMDLNHVIDRGDSLDLPDHNSFEEIDTLYRAFYSMSGKLQSSIHELITLKDQEARTRLLSLQSQMNPHFLYNNLAILSAMAEEGMNKEIVSMCRDISFILRYTAKKGPIWASIGDEMAYVRKYLACMNIRYEEDLCSAIWYPPEMESVRIPRILVQPLVENSINHGFLNEPPWEIQIKGTIQGTQWKITVADNGIGFPAGVLDNFSESPGKEDRQSHLGLWNTYQRIKLIYKDQGIFTLKNRSGGGAEVTIGGQLNQGGES